MADWLGLQALADEYKQQQAKEAWQKAHPEVPPLNTMPQTNPVAALKNKVALGNKYTPEAARQLFNTGVSYRIAPIDQNTLQQGYYKAAFANPLYQLANAIAGNPPTQRIFITNEGDTNPKSSGQDSAAEILAHEFAHKWYFENLPLSKRWDWIQNYQNDMSQQGKDTLNQYKGYYENQNLFGRLTDPIRAEAYAFQAQNGPQTMPPGTRGYYYPGLYQTDIGPEQEPPPFVPPDVPTPYTARVIPYAPSASSAKAAFSNIKPQLFDLESVIRDRQLPGPWQWRAQATPPPVFVYPWGKEASPSLSNIDLFNFAQGAEGG